MSAHQREIQQLLGQCLGDLSFDANIAISDTAAIKHLFRTKTIDPAGTQGETGSLKEVHERDALVRVCNEIITSKQPENAKLMDEIRDAEEARLAWKFLSRHLITPEDTALVDRALTRAVIDYNYATARPRQFDMFVHLSAGEMFFFDGDSLLMAAMTPQVVDWDLMQPLHVMANAQALLSRLQSRGARFHIVFFDQQRWFWEKAPQKLFLRENLRLALTEVSETNPGTGLVVQNFESYHCPEFVAYAAKYEPEFLLMSDGEQLGTPHALEKLFVHPDVASGAVVSVNGETAYRSLVEDEAHGDKVSFYYRCFLVWASARRMKVAYSTRIVAKENAIVVFAVTVDSTRFGRALVVEEQATQLAVAMEHAVVVPALSPASAAASEDTEVSLREQIIAGAVHAYLSAENVTRSEQQRQLCMVLVMTAYVTSLLDSNLRSQRRTKAPEVAAFLNELAPYLLATLYHRGCAEGRGVEHDLYDGHLLSILVHHLRTAPMSSLLDEAGVGDVEYSWGAVSNVEGEALPDTPLAALPEVQLEEEKKAITYPHFTHELVERLAKSFEVQGHVANRPYIQTLGNANRLHGWVVSHPFDSLNDVVDKEAVEEAQRSMTERERKRFLAMEAAFVTDAKQQAESMGIRGFTTEQLALVVSDDDDDDGGAAGAEAGGGDKNAAGGKVQPRAHKGQRNRKVRSKEDIIREEANLREATNTVRQWQGQVDNLLKLTERQQSVSAKERKDLLATVTAAVSRLSQQQFGRHFDPGEVLTDHAAGEEPLSLKVAMWRALVAASGMREAEFVFSTYAPGKQPQPTGQQQPQRLARRGAGSNEDPLYGFSVIAKFVEENIQGTSNDAAWGKLERLRAAKPGMTIYDASAYMNWVYLFYVQKHFLLKLNCRVVWMYLEEWRLERERARQAQQTPSVAVGTPLFLYCHHKVLSIVRDHSVCISTDDLDIVRSALAHFDFPVSYYDKIDASVTQWQGQAVPILPPGVRPRYSICSESPEMLQLLHMGHLLERPVIPERDYRVVFNPDGWQRDLLDIVDQRGCAVVCAPTSAGKTFISYYCMYNALKTSNTKVVVYVAPNRALINQAVADVCARYGSKKYSQAGKNVYGVHGGAEYHRYHDTCQVLVTLPEVLETLLLSPAYADWCKRLDYVILDEIHTMESSGNGDVWERVLALLPCPFVALSATLGETQELCGWLNRCQARIQSQQAADAAAAATGAGGSRRAGGGGGQVVRDYTVHNIPRTGSIQRWNDIKKYMYLPPPGYAPQVKKLSIKYEQRYIHDLHPLSILTMDQLHSGFPPDITLVPSEVVQLFEKMKATFEATIQPAWSHVAIVLAMQAQLVQLVPETFFATENYITQRRAREYEAAVKNAFAYWVYLNTQDDADGLDALSPEDLAAFHACMAAACESILHAFSLHLHQDEDALNNYATQAARRRLARGFALGGEKGNAANTTTSNGGSGGAAAAAAAAVAASEDGENGTPPPPPADDAAAHFPDSKGFISLNIISVLRELNARDMGPTIVFSFESEDCNDLVKSIVEQLEAAEAAYRQTEEFAQYRDTMERKAAAQVAARKQRESTLKQKRLTTNEDGKTERAERDVDNFEDDGEDFTVPDVLPEFTFIGANRTIDPVAVRKAIEECEKRGDTLAIRAIQRGVGIHHAEVKGKLRRLMEMLFRGRHCGVICATETLALGVHSPCRSVVLAGDHVLLNTTQFRQMMGRAGRRGLDHLGHLVFLSISMKKITRLMTSSMTVIKGNVQMDPISQLRLLQLYDYARHREQAPRAQERWEQRALQLAERLFVNPLFFEGRAAVEGGNMEAFSIEFLQLLLGFFQKEGLHFYDRPSSLGSLLVDAMYIFRNAQVGMEGFAFISMLTSGIFAAAKFTGEFEHLNSGVYETSDGLSERVLSHPVLKQHPCNEALAELLAYLFSVHRICGVPLEVHRSALHDPAVAALWRPRENRRHHRVVLAPLHACAPGQTPLDNTTALRVISSFYTFLASTLQSPAASHLPFMSARTRRTNPIFSTPDEELPLTQRLRETAVPFAARDAFVAVSGCGDAFASTEDLVSTLRAGLFCDRRMLPLLDLSDNCRHDNGQVLINACVADFVRCRAQVDSVRSNYRFTLLEELNGLTQSESFSILNHVEGILSNLAGLVRGSELEQMKVLEALLPEAGTEGAYFGGAPNILHLSDRLYNLRPQILKDFAGEQLRQRQAETRQRQEAQRQAAAAARK